MLFAQFDRWRGVGVDDALHVRVSIISILVSSHPNVAGQNFLRRAIGQAREQQLLASIVGQRQQKQLVAAFVVVRKVGSLLALAACVSITGVC
jgi:hypothetical protein